MEQNDTEMIDCREAITKLYMFLDDEITAGEVSKFKTHIERCGHCNEVALFYEKFKKVMKSSCGVEMPTGLKEKLISSIKAA
ncbi:MAG: mycothiol system anti-sigma-R factor [Calditrichaeota bacterium]|nr:MAG: mycothiol system anti-sigma-R factor [Calditrichota bacterium]